jgi:hypothetical protein
MPALMLAPSPELPVSDAPRPRRKRIPRLPTLLPIDGAPVTQLERAEAARDAAVYDLAQSHRLLSEVGVPAHIAGRPSTLTERMRMMLAAIHVGNTERHIMVAVSRAGAS